MQWDKITDIILATALALLGVFALLGLYQLITRRSFKGVDLELRAFIPPLVVMAATYIIFDKFLILSTRPDGSGEPSFPSSHTMIIATIFFCIILALKKYVRKKPLRITLDIIMLVLIALAAAGRILANKHWPMDVACGLVFAAVFAGIYYLIIKKGTTHAKHLHQDN
ncbi:phosphatase PAP2 family protein [Candidatus Saccharibacteria bacterium]|nr:phosphatase PAP2 family protein [Candidatus Saccharibacteria bacterium]MBQ6375908.1 phosphatase PAP2 family protein [Candidatus Saccharibacteria bacterium]